MKKSVDETQSVLTIAQNELTIYTSAAQKERIRLDQLQTSITSTKEQLKDKGARLEELRKLVPSKDKELLNTQRESQQVIFWALKSSLPPPHPTFFAPELSTLLTLKPNFRLFVARSPDMFKNITKKEGSLNG